VVLCCLAISGCHLFLPLSPGRDSQVREASTPSDAPGCHASPGSVSLDCSFARHGFISVQGLAKDEDYAAGAAIDSKGRLVVAGQVTRSKNGAPPNEVPNKDAVIWRFLPDGAPDDSFGGGQVIRSQSNRDFARSVAIAGGDVVVAAGNMEWSQQDAPTVWHILPTGEPDARFGSGGASHSSVAGYQVAGADQAFDMTVGDSVVLGNEHNLSWISVSWLSPTGTLNESFGSTGGHVEFSPPETTNPSGARLRFDGSRRVVVVGSSHPRGAGSDRDLTVWRINTNGALDSTFGPARKGFFTHDGAVSLGADEAGADFDLDGAGDLYVCGTTSGSVGSQAVVWKVRADGSLAGGFGDGGIALADGPPTAASACRLYADGRLLIAGTRGDAAGRMKLALWRLQPDGRADPALGGLALTDLFPGRDEQVRSLTLDGASRAIVCGNVGTGSSSDMVVWRLNLP
jgi:uncharacterized delta-60 repeat protein